MGSNSTPTVSGHYLWLDWQLKGYCRWLKQTSKIHLLVYSSKFGVQPICQIYQWMYCYQLKLAP